MAGLVRMGSGFNTAYALIDDHEAGKRVHFKKIADEKPHDSKFEGDKTQMMNPDGYITKLLEKDSPNQIPKKEI